MKTFLLTATYLVGLGELALAVFFWVTHSKSEIRKVMALLFLSTGIWAITNGLTSYVDPSTWVDWNLKILFIVGITIVASLLHLTIIFPYRIFPFDKLHSFLIYAPVVFMSITLLTSNAIVGSYEVSRNEVGLVHPGPLFIFFQVTVSIYYIISVIILLIKHKRLDGLHKQNIRLFTTGVVLGGFPAIVLNLMYAFSGLYINPLWAVIFSISWVGFTAYIILKK